MADIPKPPDPRSMTDEELCRAWSAVQDHDNLTPFDQAVMDEMAKREIDF